MRPIDADVVIEKVMNYCKDDDGSCVEASADIRELLDEIENLPTIQPEPQWIPVSERLPEESGYYIATTHDGVGRRTTFVKYQKKAKSWELTGARSYWRVIAWMPLPEPYNPNK